MSSKEEEVTNYVETEDKLRSTQNEDEMLDERMEEEEMNKEEMNVSNWRSYSEVAQMGEDDNATQVVENDEWVTHRVKISIKIKEPKDKEQRLKLLYTKVNKILKIGRKSVTSLQMSRFCNMRTSKSEHFNR